MTRSFNILCCNVSVMQDMMISGCRNGEQIPKEMHTKTRSVCLIRVNIFFLSVCLTDTERRLIKKNSSSSRTATKKNIMQTKDTTEKVFT